MISVEIIEDRERIKHYYPQWEELFTSRKCESSLSVEWTEALLKSHLEESTVYFVVLKEPRGIAGILPLYLKEITKSGVPLLTLCPVSEHFNTHSDMLVDGLSPQVVALVLKAIFGMRERWDVFRMNRLVDGNPLLSNIENTLRSSFAYKFEIQTAEPSFFIQLGDNYNEYVNARSSKLRYQLRHASKRLHCMGALRFTSEQKVEEFDEVFETVLSIERASWKHKNGTGIASTDKQRRFYRELCEREFKKGRLRFWLLHVNSTPIAYEVGIVKDKTYYSVHGSYDDAFKRESPGSLLFARVIEDLIHLGIRELDFFGEPFEWQQHWTDDIRWHRSLLIYNNTQKARLFYLYNRLKGISNFRKGDELVLRNPHEIKPQQT